MKYYTLSKRNYLCGDRMFPNKNGQWDFREDCQALDETRKHSDNVLYELAGFLFESVPEASHVPNEEIIRLVDEFRESGRLK